MLFQTWYTRTPRGWVGRMLQQTSRINPDMSLWLFDNQDVDAFVKLEFPSVWRSVWPHLHGAYRIQRYDLFRLLVVLRYGGVYYDIDMETLYPVSPLLRRHSAVFAVEEVVPQDACRSVLGWQKDVLSSTSYCQVNRFFSCLAGRGSGRPAGGSGTTAARHCPC